MGYRVVALYGHDQKSADVASKELGAESTAIQVDVSSPEEVSRVANRIINEYGAPRILVNNAGRNIDKPLTEISDSDWRAVLDTNLSGPFYMARSFAGPMLEAGGGSIINIAATTGIRPRFNGVNYCSSKAGLLHLTKCLALELAPKIRVNSLIPGMIDTEDMRMRVQNAPAEHRESMFTSIPQERIGTPEEMADALEFLAGDESRYITGQKLIVDGGQFMW
ncbi:acetoacetyl-CoA reductase [Actinopolyspora lacussalsi subsp. righensis]|uniref:Acetoacetyl-CoA reductase n=2 Tax=Actinopolyspora righensis TaxID=995060 RepID=A0A1I6X1Q3_9ACTN|nr:acetoacetyl-CoA reductase [Actinopolyspora righensis]